MRHFLKITAVLALALTSCGEGPREVPAPLDRFTFPTGLAIVPLPGGGRGLAVVSANFDLRFSPDDGGSVLLVDPDRSSGDEVVELGAIRIGSFGGEPTVLSAAPVAGAAPSCASWTGSTEILVTSRTSNALYRIPVGEGGALTCGDGCKVPLSEQLADPFAVQIVCRKPAPDVDEQVAFLSHLRSPGSRGWLTRLDLAKPLASGEAAGATVNPTLVDLGAQPTTGAFAYDAARERLYVTGRFGVIDLAPLHWLDLATPGAVTTANLGQDVRGSEIRAIALSSDGTRAYVAMRLFDQDIATTVGGRTNDIGGALAIFDMTERAGGGPERRLLRLVPVGLGPAQVHVMPRAGRRDLVAVSSPDDGTVTLYDDDAGTVGAVLGAVAIPDPLESVPARPFGRQPYALASEPAADPGLRTLYVSSFDRGFVRVVTVDLAQPARSTIGKRFGREVP